MNIVFAGTPEFARVALQALVQAGFSVPLVLTQPDRPAGRGLKLQASPVKQYALEQGIAVEQPRSLRLDGKFPEDAARAQSVLEAVRADVMVVAAYGLILPQWVLDLPARGCLNIHASLLPRWRGAAPIHRAIEAGDAQTGVTIMQMDAGLDTGDMLLSETMPILSTDTTATLHDRLAEQGGRLIVQALVQMQGADLHRVPQPVEGVTYAHKIDKAESSVDWTQPAEAIGRHIRALTPFPGASTTLDGELIKLVDYEIDSFQRLTDKRCGQILSVNSQGITVACGEGALRLTVLQRAGGKRLAAADFVRGFPLLPGMVLGPSAQTGSGG
ncbi:MULTISPECIES: methionyl-tRNA formyltransferase [unclassified Simplicispira]|uniref:methionyl-tRNA formyltransferase n=1 Tax=unclassified Simplicispira TaxID=2630407 RepID=UPI000D5DF36C|nr:MULTISPECIES: methionyl-tRNA formyltransferase [unclassified Simplicispira]MBH1977637.1 methionyl-tRNA formyltransferase [Comamonadaceae bacterium]PVY57324.1 methionyl-tRNA formyltransferase [Simplicispira sp. 125]REG18269.1 methionyl-tRNA formyltransferase [Simplicispira sp. 110]